MRHALSRHHVRQHHRRPEQRHTSLSIITVVGGLIAFFAGVVPAAHFAAVVVGVCTFVFGLYSQLVSATTSERWGNVIGIGLAFVGAGLGLSHGGFRI